MRVAATRQAVAAHATVATVSGPSGRTATRARSPQRGQGVVDHGGEVVHRDEQGVGGHLRRVMPSL